MPQVHLDKGELRYIHGMLEARRKRREKNVRKLREKVEAHGGTFVLPDDHHEAMRFLRHLRTKIERALEGGR